MREAEGRRAGAVIIVHGGAGPMDPSEAFIREATADVIAIARACLPSLRGSTDPLETVEQGLVALEDNPRFNAGYGSALQADGAARLTAAVMSGTPGRFSGVISAEHIRHPSRIARVLQDASSRVLTSPGVELKAREMGMPVESLTTAPRLDEYLPRAARQLRLMDTVGVVVRNAEGQLAAGTSTGGRGLEAPGRVSDSATVAGNYASTHGAFSATGIGEQIVDDALCARLETRVRDGMTLVAASRRCFQEARERGRAYGWIGLDSGDRWIASHTTRAMTFAVLSGEGEVLASSLPD